MPSITDSYSLDDLIEQPVEDEPAVSLIGGDTSDADISAITIESGTTQSGTPDKITVPRPTQGGTPDEFAWSSQPEPGSSPSYSSILSIDARIVGLSDGIVEMECLIDPEEGIIEVREFDSADLEGIVPLVYHQYVYIRVLRSPGRVVHTFSNGDYRRNVVGKLFEPIDPFDGLSSEAFNDPVEW